MQAGVDCDESKIRNVLGPARLAVMPLGWRNSFCEYLECSLAPKPRNMKVSPIEVNKSVKTFPSTANMEIK